MTPEELDLLKGLGTSLVGGLIGGFAAILGNYMAHKSSMNKARDDARRTFQREYEKSVRDQYAAILSFVLAGSRGADPSPLSDAVARMSLVGSEDVGARFAEATTAAGSEGPSAFARFEGPLLDRMAAHLKRIEDEATG